MWKSKAKLTENQLNDNTSTPATVINTSSIQHNHTPPDSLDHLSLQFIQPCDGPETFNIHPEDAELKIQDIPVEEPSQVSTDRTTIHNPIDNETDNIDQRPLPPANYIFVLPMPPSTLRRSRPGRAIKTASRFDDSPHSS